MRPVDKLNDSSNKLLGNFFIMRANRRPFSDKIEGNIFLKSKRTQNTNYQIGNFQSKLDTNKGWDRIGEEGGIGGNNLGK